MYCLYAGGGQIGALHAELGRAIRSSSSQRYRNGFRLLGSQGFSLSRASTILPPDLLHLFSPPTTHHIKHTQRRRGISTDKRVRELEEEANGGPPGILLLQEAWRIRAAEVKQIGNWRLFATGHPGAQEGTAQLPWRTSQSTSSRGTTLSPGSPPDALTSLDRRSWLSQSMHQ